jgi:hypothetical protein
MAYEVLLVVAGDGLPRAIRSEMPRVLFAAQKGRSGREHRMAWAESPEVAPTMLCVGERGVVGTRSASSRTTPPDRTGQTTLFRGCAGGSVLTEKGAGQRSSRPERWRPRSRRPTHPGPLMMAESARGSPPPQTHSGSCRGPFTNGRALAGTKSDSNPSPLGRRRIPLRSGPRTGPL